MMKTQSTTRPLTILVAAAMLMPALIMAGCSSTPYYDKHGHRGRIDPTITTRAEMKDPAILPAALIEFSDQMPQTLSRRIVSAPQIRDTPGQITVIMGDIANKTNIVSTNDFEMMTQRMRSNLLASQFMRERIRFVENRARMRRLAAKELGVSPEEVPAPKYDVKTSYAMTADVYRVGRGGTNLYYMQVQLVSFATNTIVFNDRFEIKQVRK